MFENKVLAITGGTGTFGSAVYSTMKKLLIRERLLFA